MRVEKVVLILYSVKAVILNYTASITTPLPILIEHSWLEPYAQF